MITKFGKKIQYDYLKFLIGIINYGGRVIDLKDNTILTNFLNSFLSEQAIVLGDFY